MNKFANILLTTILCGYLHAETEGYYKDVFMDGGVRLTSRESLYAVDSLGLSIEALATETLSWQTKIIVGEDSDVNGHLLYPDGAPRFRVIYTNGGKASAHGSSLGEEGRKRIVKFYKMGGSYTGSCAGAFISSLGYGAVEDTCEYYYYVWPGWTIHSGINDAFVDHILPSNSPLLQYNDFGGDLLIENIWHNGGGYVNKFAKPSKTETLLLMNGKINTFAYKENENYGRIVATFSHPEGEETGEQLHLMMAILQYALNGQGKQHIKAELVNGENRIMNKSTADNDPDFTKIGDKQYHHYKVNLPEENNTLRVDLNGNDNYDLDLFVHSDTFAFADAAEFENVELGADKFLLVENLPMGDYFISVKCVNTVKSIANIYMGDLTVLNGVDYTIRASWNDKISGIEEPKNSAGNYILNQNYPNPFNPSTTIRYSLQEMAEVVLLIYDIRGKFIKSLHTGQQSAGNHQIQWNGVDQVGNPVSTGVYLCRLNAGSFSETIKMLYLK